MKNNHETRQQHLREILGKNEQWRLCFSELVYCVALSIKVLIECFTKRLKLYNYKIIKYL